MPQAAQEHQKHINQIAKLIRRIEIAMLTTVLPDGTVQSRPMVTQQEPFDGTLWFLCRKGTPKLEHIHQHAPVGVSYADTQQKCFVSLSGVAKQVSSPDKVRELWNKSHQNWFPEGPDDPEIVLLRVEIERAEYWEDSRLVSLVGFSKAYLLAEQEEGVEQLSLSLSGQR